MSYNKTILSLCLIAGIIACAYQNSFMSIQWPWNKRAGTIAHQHATKQAITLYYWHHGSWHTEKNNLIMPQNTLQALTYVINSWLTLLNEEQISAKKVTLETALLSPTGHELFVSFDRTPFSAEQSTYEKWLWIEGLLKTIKNYMTSIGQVRFLVHHKPLQDTHLDFSNAWPINGFLLP